jgi:hypothetical protein
MSSREWARHGAARVIDRRKPQAPSATTVIATPSPTGSPEGPSCRKRCPLLAREPNGVLCAVHRRDRNPNDVAILMGRVLLWPREFYLRSKLL